MIEHFVQCKSFVEHATISIGVSNYIYIYIYIYIYSLIINNIPITFDAKLVLNRCEEK
jgi:hypothetical protein